MSIISIPIKTRFTRVCCYTLLWVLIPILLTGCSLIRPAPPIGAKEVLAAMLTVEANPPDGIIRTRNAPRDQESTATDPSELSDALFSALYSADCLSWFEPVTLPDGTVGAPIMDDAAMYLSTVQHPFELAVFRCTDSAGTVAAAKQCSGRLDTIRRAWQGSDEEAHAGRGCVEVVGNYVLLVVATDQEAVLNAARQCIK